MDLHDATIQPVAKSRKWKKSSRYIHAPVTGMLSTQITKLWVEGTTPLLGIQVPSPLTSQHNCATGRSNHVTHTNQHYLRYNKKCPHLRKCALSHAQCVGNRKCSLWEKQTIYTSSTLSNSHYEATRRTWCKWSLNTSPLENMDI